MAVVRVVAEEDDRGALVLRNERCNGKDARVLVVGGESWWHVPVLHLSVFWTGVGGEWLLPYGLDSLGQKHHLDFLAFLANLVALAWYLALVGTLVLLPVVVVVQLARRQWKTAGKTGVLAVEVVAIVAGRGFWRRG